MQLPSAEIFSQGEEVVCGDIADTNAAWLSRELTGLGFEVRRHTAVGDRLDSLVDLLREISGRASLCLCTGGLGPTSDDLTAEAVSLAFGRPLRLDTEALAQIEAWFRQTGRTMPAVNRKQALLPEGATRLDNRWGTAPGFSVSSGNCLFHFMPGVPREMKAMYRASIAPALPGLYLLAPLQRVVLHTVGLGESALQERLDSVPLPPGTRLGFRAGGAENQVKLAFPGDLDIAPLEATIAAVSAAIGEACHAVVRNGVGPASLTESVGLLLCGSGARLWLLESVSGGLLASRCGDQDWLAAALVAPATHGLLARFGLRAAARPAATALRLARALLDQGAGAGGGPDHALVQWTESRPAELREENRQAELFVAIAGPHGDVVEQRLLAGSWPRKRDSAAAFSLDALRRFLASRSSR